MAPTRPQLTLQDQLLAFAESGLLTTTGDPDVGLRDRASSAVTQLYAACAWSGCCLTAAIVGVQREAALTMAIAVIALIPGLVALLEAMGDLIALRADRPVHVRTGALVPGSMAVVGDWVRRAGGWARVEQIGRTPTEAVALLSDRSVLVLDQPVRIAARPFRHLPTLDPHRGPLATSGPVWQHRVGSRSRDLVMGWIDRRPRDANEQILEFASSGRLIDLDPRTAVHAADKGSTVFAMVLAAAAVGVGATLVMIAAVTESLLAAFVGLSVITVSLALLLPAVRLVRMHTSSRAAMVKPGAVLPPELVRQGNWIYRGGAWNRVEQIGRGGEGDLTALLSSGEVIDLTAPVTIAGGDFRPVSDPVATLRG